MSLYSRFCGLETTPSLLGAGGTVLFLKVLRRFINAGKRFDGQRKLKGMSGRDCCFEDKRQTRPWLNFPRSTVPTGFCPDSKTITGGCGENAHRGSAIDADLQPQTVKRSKHECVPFPETSTSKSLSSSVAEVFGKIQGIFCLSEAVVSVYTAKINAFRTHSATCGESIFSRYVSQIIEASPLHRRLSVLTSVSRPLGRFATNPQSHFNPSTALCAVSQ